MTSLTREFRRRTKKKKKTKRIKRRTTTTRRQPPKKRPSRVTDGQLKRKYRDPKEPGSLGGVARFCQRARHHGPKSQTHLGARIGLHVAQTHASSFSHVESVGVLDPTNSGRADLVDVQKLKRENKGTNYLLTVVDVFSKYAWVLPIKQKTGTARGRDPRNAVQDQQENTSKVTGRTTGK